VSDRLDELGRSTDVVLVTFTDPNNLGASAQANALPFPVLADPDRSAYRAFGLGRGSVARVWGWRSARKYAELLWAHRSSRRPTNRPARSLPRRRGPTEDTLQLGGDFVVGGDGTLAYGFWGDGPDDRPTVDELIDAVRALGS